MRNLIRYQEWSDTKGRRFSINSPNRIFLKIVLNGPRIEPKVRGIVRKKTQRSLTQV